MNVSRLSYDKSFTLSLCSKEERHEIFIFKMLSSSSNAVSLFCCGLNVNHDVSHATDEVYYELDVYFCTNDKPLCSF
jgi:hypothetical protein